MIALKLPSFPTSVLLLGSFIGLFCIYGSVTTSARATSSPSQKGDPNTLAGQFQELQKQVADLQKLVTELQKTRIVASGTTTFKLAGDQDNATNVRVVLNEEIAKRIGEDYIVLLTRRFPTAVIRFPFLSGSGRLMDLTSHSLMLPSDRKRRHPTQQIRTNLISLIGLW